MTPTQIKAAYTGGLNLNELAARTGLPWPRIKALLLDQGCRIRKRGNIRKLVPEGTAAEVIRLLAAGVRQQDVAEQLGVTKQRVSQIKFRWKTTNETKL